MRLASSSRLAFVIVLASLVPGCSGCDSTASNGGSGNGGGGSDGGGSIVPGADGSVGGDASVAGDAGLAGFCSGSGPLLLVPGAGGASLCSGELAQTTFRYAVCSCGRFAISNTFATDSFDSRDGAYSSASSGNAGSFGTNGNVTLHAAADVGGSVWVHGTSGISAGASGALHAAGELKVNGPLSSASSVVVGHDAFVEGDLSAASLSVGATLTQPAGALRTVAGATSVGALASAPVDFPPPCACEADELVDVAGLVAAQATANDNAAAGFDPSVLVGYTGPTTIDLPCGRLHAPSLSGNGTLTLRVAHRTALFLGGDLEPGADFRVEIVGGGELDLFVEGNVVSAHRLDLGSIDAPSRVRLYVGGSQPIALSGGAVFAGNVYAPHAEFTMSTAIEIYGSLFAAGIVASDRLTVHYDAAILAAGNDCGPPPSTCTSCRDCGNQACTAGGSCGACTSNADCCSPLVCHAGSCVPEIVIE